jgi:diaminopimelate epimerase
MKTGLPTGCPKELEIGVGKTHDNTWANLGFPSSAPNDMYCYSDSTSELNIDDINGLTVTLPVNETWAKDLPKKLTLSGKFVFTGEPHLVFFLGCGLPTHLESRIWLAPEVLSTAGMPDTSQMTMSKAMIHYIGSFVNTTYRNLFPQGVHLNFARVNKDKTVVEYRTYERAIDRETLACGSGAVSIAYVGWAMGILADHMITLKPHRCCWFQPHSKLEVSKTTTGLILSGRPEFIYEGAIPKLA